MKGMSSPILSPQFFARRDFFVEISTEMGMSPLTTDDSIDTVALVLLTSSVDSLSVVTDSLSVVTGSLSVVTDASSVMAVEVEVTFEISSSIVVLGVDSVLRRVNRTLLVLTEAFVDGVVPPSDSHAITSEGKPRKTHEFLVLYDREKLMLIMC